MERPEISTSGSKCTAILLAWVACALTLTGNVVRAESITHHYTITVDYSLETMYVEARFSRSVVSVTARSRDAGKFLTDVRGCNDHQQIRLRNRRMMLPESGIDCIKYTVDLERAAKENRNSKLLAPGNIIASPSYWLWHGSKIP